MIIGYAIFPFIWSVPIGLATCELGTGWPENGGVVVWGKVAFSEFWGFLGGVLCAVEGVCNLAVFPTVTLDYILELSGLSDDSPLLSWTLKASMCVALALLNVRGIDWVGSSVAVLSVVVTVPLVIFCLLGLFHLQDTSVWLQSRRNDYEGETNWAFFIGILVFNLSGYDNIGSVCGEVKDPGRTMPIAMLISIALGSLAFLLPLMIGVAIDPDYDHWHAGYLAKLGGTVSGPWLAVVLTLAAAVSRLSAFIAELCTNAFFVQGMAEERMVPAVLGERHEEYGSPWVAILANTAVILALVSLSLPEILELSNAFTIGGVMLILCSLLRLRATHPDVPRPYAIPLGTVGLWILFTPCFLISAYVIASLSLRTISVCVGLLGSAVLARTALVEARANGWGPMLPRLSDPAQAPPPRPAPPAGRPDSTV